MTDFFISYTHADEKSAEWIAYVLEENNYSTVIQAWDFNPGSNFVLEMQKAAATAERTIMVLSPDYLNSKMAAAEWASAFAKDAEGISRRVVPVMVRDCNPEGLLPTIVQIRLMDKDEEAAERALLTGVAKGRGKPASRPTFFGLPSNHPTVSDSERSREETQSREPAVILPKIPGRWTDVERRRFLKKGFMTISETFLRNVEAAADQNPRLESDFTTASATNFSAELFLDGKSCCRCRVWLSSEMGGETIGFQEGNTSGNAYNEMLFPSRDGEPLFSATMASGYYENERKFDLKRLTAKDAADWLWLRFVRPLSY